MLLSRGAFRRARAFWAATVTTMELYYSAEGLVDGDGGNDTLWLLKVSGARCRSVRAKTIS